MTGNIETYQTSTGHSSNLHNMRFVAATAEQVYSKTIKKVTSGEVPIPIRERVKLGKHLQNQTSFLPSRCLLAENTWPASLRRA